jgi:iron(III) transport system substrate-binding protein
MNPRSIFVVVALVLLLAACSADEPGTLRIYTSVTQATVDAVVDGYTERFPEAQVEVFRAPTGELTARLAAEQRDGGIRADVLWLTDPLSMQQYAADGMLAVWEPAGIAAFPPEYVNESFWGTRVLSMVMIAGTGVQAPDTWSDLIDPRFEGRVAFPDPGFAGSSLAVLGFFSAADGYGLEFYEKLAANGAVQVSAPGEVVTGVAEGRFDAGITLRFSARAAVDGGSPIEIVWPSEGAIALYSPIGVVDGSSERPSAEDFVEYVLTTDAQERIAATGWQPASTEVEWDPGGPVVTVDWSVLFDRQRELLDAYRAIFGG